MPFKYTKGDDELQMLNHLLQEWILCTAVAGRITKAGMEFINVNLYCKPLLTLISLSAPLLAFQVMESDLLPQSTAYPVTS